MLYLRGDKWYNLILKLKFSCQLYNYSTSYFELKDKGLLICLVNLILFLKSKEYFIVQIYRKLGISYSFNILLYQMVNKNPQNSLLFSSYKLNPHKGAFFRFYSLSLCLSLLKPIK